MDNRHKTLAALGLTALYATVLVAVYLFHALWLPVNVIFYSAMLDALIAVLLLSVLLVFVGRRFSGFEKGLLVTIWLLCGYAFALSGPTVLDRSLSFYLLEKLQQRGGGIRADAIEQVFVREYMPEFRLVDVRLTEQLESGTITIENGCVKLTAKGKRLASFSRFVRQNLLAKNRLLAGEYSDDLVDPFKNSQTRAVGYECG